MPTQRCCSCSRSLLCKPIESGLSAGRNLYRVTNPPIKLHPLHPPPSAITPKGYLLPEFDSGATGLTGRFNEGFLLRRLQSFRVMQALSCSYECSTQDSPILAL